MQKTMIIVGAGIAGLSTGCYAQMNGYKTFIFESHAVPGGLCAAWTRKGYTFDISMHMLANSKFGPFKKMWDELEVTKDQEFYYHNSIVTVEGKEKKLDFCLDRASLEKQMLSVSPDDAVLIKEFNDIFFGRSIINLASLDPPELTGFIGGIKTAISFIPFLRAFKKYGKATVQEFAARLKDPFLARAIQSSVDTPGWPMPGYPMFALAGFAQAGGAGAGYPLGGSRKVMFKMAKLYERLGGVLRCGSAVKDVLIENDTAAGVRLADDSERAADIIVWAGDGHRLIFDILGGKYMDDAIRDMYDSWRVVKPIVHVCFGVDMDLSGEPQKMVYEVEKPITVAGREFNWISIMLHGFDKSAAPAGKTALEVWYATDYAYWEELIRDRAKYDAEKKRITEETADALEKRWPGFKSKIEVTDTPTPMTYVKYTHNWQGSPDGWYITPENMTKQQMKRTLPGLGNLYMAGQWTAPFTGTVIAALSGRQIIQLLCKKDGRNFVTKTNAG